MKLAPECHATVMTMRIAEDIVVNAACERARADAVYPATDFGHETGCPDTVGVLHIGRTCQEMIAIDRRIVANAKAAVAECVALAIPMPPRRVIHLRSNDATNKRNVAALARVGGFAYTEGGL